jgi:hypothetical protein
MSDAFSTNGPPGARPPHEDAHETAVACLQILAAVDGRTLTEDMIARLGELARLAAEFPSPDPFASTTAIEFCGHWATSWHGAVCKVAAAWAAGLPAAWAEAQQCGQAVGSPSLWPGALQVRALLEAEANAHLATAPAPSAPQPGPVTVTSQEAAVLKVMLGHHPMRVTIVQLTHRLRLGERSVRNYLAALEGRAPALVSARAGKRGRHLTRAGWKLARRLSEDAGRPFFR